MKNINNIMTIILLIVYDFNTSEMCYDVDIKNTLKAINNNTKHVKQIFRNKMKMIPISYLPNIEENLLEYPGKKSDTLMIIKDEWTNYYKCLNEQIRIYERDHMIPLIATTSLVGTTLKLECGLCQSPMDINILPEWHYSDNYSIDTENILKNVENKIISSDDNSLSIYNIKYKDYGLYFCKLKNISGPNYYVHIVDNSEPLIKVWPDTAFKSKHKLHEVEFQELGIILKTEWSDWTNCNRCGRTGKRMRYGMCIVVTTVNNQEKAQRGIPCRSKLLPDHILQKKEVIQRSNQIMFSFCKVPCKETEVFIEYEEMNTAVAVFNNSEGVYSLNQLLPPLKPQPERTTIYVQYNSKTKLLCPGNLNTDTPVSWSIELTPIYGSIIENKTNGRIIIDSLNQVVFNKVRFSDMHTYSCWQDKELAGSIHLIVFHTPSNTTDTYIAVFSGSIIIVTIIFIFYRVHKNKFLPKLK